MKTAAFITGIVFVCCLFTETTTAEGLDDVVKTECRDRYLWVQVTSAQPPRFEAVDGNGAHSISEQLASRCGYTISTFKMDGYTTFRASYFSCFTQNQDDKVFSFSFNVILSDAGGMWTNRPVSAVCSGLVWTHREIICEEDYMEVNVNRESCGGQKGVGGETWHTIFTQAQRMATSVWQLMFLQSDGQVSSMTTSEAQRQGYSLTTSTHRVVLRSGYKQPQAELMMVDGVPVEVVQVSLFLKQKLTVVFVDVSMACTVNSGSFDGARLLWDIPHVLTPLVKEGASFKSESLSLGVEGVLLDQPTIAARGFSLVQLGHLVQIRVPFGTEGGYRKSMVVNNVYKETYVIFLLFEHIFSLLYEDGSSIITRHRMVRVLATPPLCRPAFALDHTISDHQVFSIHLGNIPADVILEEVRINGKQLMLEAAGQGSSLSPVTHINGSRAYDLRLPFKDGTVHRTYLGQGVVQYTIDVNFTLTIMPQRSSYYHQSLITARVLNAFPPEITAQCLDGGISFTVLRQPPAQSLWEVGVDHEPLTSQLAAERGYVLYNDGYRTTLEVPIFSIGYTYQDINLSTFHGTFKLLLRDSKTLEVQTSSSKRCRFKTEDMIVCSADGTMTVVTSPSYTWPTVQPGRTTLLDPTCGPKQADGSRVLFEFRINSCGTRAVVGDSYVVYENEILHNRQLIADGPNLISRESQFKLTVRCFYPLSGVSRLSVDRIVRSETPGFGSIKVFKSLKDPPHDLNECLGLVPGNVQTDQVYQTTASKEVLPHSRINPRPRPGPSHFMTVPGGHYKLLHSSPNISPTSEGQTTNALQIPLQDPPLPGLAESQNQDQPVFGSLADDRHPTVHPKYDQLPDSIQGPNLHTMSTSWAQIKGSSLVDGNSDFRSPDSSAVEQLGGGFTQGPHNLDNTWPSGLPWDQTTQDQSGIIKPKEILQSLKGNLSSGMQDLSLQLEASPELSLYGSSSDIMEMTSTGEMPSYQSHGENNPSQTSQLHPVLQSPAQSSSELHLPTKHLTFINTVPSTHSSAAPSHDNQNQDRPGAVARRNAETVQSSVQNIRVKPLSKFVFSGRQLQNPNSRTSYPLQHITGLTDVTRDGDHRKSTEEYVLRPGSSTLKPYQGFHGVQVESDQSLIHLKDPSLLQLHPNLQDHQKVVQSVTERRNVGHLASPLRNIPRPPGASHIRVRPVPSLLERLQIHQDPKPQAGSISSLNVTPQTTPFITGPSRAAEGSGGLGSDLKNHRSYCGGPYGASIHEGVMRGKQTN